jgi:putative ABC transport system permease protein
MDESGTPTWRRYLRFWGANSPSDVDDELKFHTEMRVAEYVRTGMPIDAARAAAERRLGDVGLARADCIRIHAEHERSMTRSIWLDGLRQDIVFAVRVLRRQPLPTVASAFCLALGIGASTAMFSVADTMLRRPLPFPNGDRLVSLGSITGGKASAGVFSIPDFADMRARQRTFQDLGAATSQSFTWLRSEPLRVNGAIVTGTLFNTLGVRAEAGRLLQANDDRPGAERVVVVSRGFADRWLGGAATALDKTMNLGGRSYRIVGVVPDAWRYPEYADLFVAVARDPLEASRGSRYLRVLGALAPNVRIEQARADLSSVAASMRRDFVADSAASLHVDIQPLRVRYVGSARPALAALGVATLLVLLVACANVAGLQLARASARYKEIALRSAIGARRGRLLRQLLTESVLLALVGGIAGCLLAVWASRLIGGVVAESAPPWMTFALDPWALAFAVIVSSIAGVAFGIAPALRLGRVDPAAAFRSGGMTGPQRGRLQRTFVAAEIALSTVLLVGAGFAIQSVNSLAQVPLGFEPSGALTFRLSLQGLRYDSAANRASAVAALSDRIAAIPGIRSVGAVTRIPVSGCCSAFGTTIEGQEGKYPGLMVTGNMVTPGYFETLGIHVLRGRGILPTDVKAEPRVVVINETFAKRYWPDGEALGHRIATGGGMAEIVGIATDIKQNSLIEPPEPQFYRAHAQDPWEDMTFVVRVKAGDPAAIIPAIRRAFHELDPTQPLFSVTPMSDLVARGMSSERVLGRLLGAFALVALIFAAAGVYAAMSFFVAQRTQELGLRMALGADRSNVVGLVLARAAGVTAAGLTAGLVGAVAAGRVLSHHMYGVDAGDARMYGIAAGVLGLAALVATLGPSRRAVTVDPMAVLRTEGS